MASDDRGAVQAGVDVVSDPTRENRIARLALHRMDRHEAESYEGGGSETFTDPDGGLLRYGRALRNVLDLCDGWENTLREHAFSAFVDHLRQAIGWEMGVTQAPPPGVRCG